MVDGPQKETGLGIASFVISMVMLVMWFVLVAIAAAVAAGAPDDSPVLIGVGLLLFGGIGANIIGLIFGIIAVGKENVKKTLAAVGLTLNSVELLGIIFLIILGSVSE